MMLLAFHRHEVKQWKLIQAAERRIKHSINIKNIQETLLQDNGNIQWNIQWK
jgi:hypothetical protein